MQRQRLGVTMLAMGVLAITALGVEGCGSSTVRADEVDPTVAMTAISDSLQTAWNAGDGPGYASSFTDDADFVNIRGDVFTGRAQIAQVHKMILAGPFKGSHIAITVRKLEILAPGIALLDTDQAVTGFAGLPAGVTPTSEGTLMTHFKYIGSKQSDGSWKLISGQNTSELPGRMTLPPG